MKQTLQSITDALGVSEAAVPRVLNGRTARDSVSPATDTPTAACRAREKYAISFQQEETR